MYRDQAECAMNSVFRSDSVALPHHPATLNDASIQPWQPKNGTPDKDSLVKALSRIFIVISGAIIASAVQAGPREELLDRYAREAKASEAAFSAFSSRSGEALHIARHATGKPDTPSCTACHGDDPRRPGQTKTGKSIDPMAVSVSQSRYTDAAKVEKWFRRNCTEVLGRACTPREKGDWLTYMISQ